MEAAKITVDELCNIFPLLNNENANKLAFNISDLMRQTLFAVDHESKKRAEFKQLEKSKKCVKKAIDSVKSVPSDISGSYQHFINAAQAWLNCIPKTIPQNTKNKHFERLIELVLIECKIVMPQTVIYHAENDELPFFKLCKLIIEKTFSRGDDSIFKYLKVVSKNRKLIEATIDSLKAKGYTESVDSEIFWKELQAQKVSRGNKTAKT